MSHVVTIFYQKGCLLLRQLWCHNECMKTIASPVPYSLQELSVLTECSPRTIRYYIQAGLVERPVGETRSARYGTRHLEQLLLIKKWTAAGVSLERVRQLLQGDAAPLPDTARKPGTVEVCTRLLIADGVELLIEAVRARLSPEQVRALTLAVMQEYARVSANPCGGHDDPPRKNNKET